MWFWTVALNGAVLADEGMWMPGQVPAMADRLENMGLTLPVEQLSDPQSEALTAVVSLGGCSASFVSPDGLIITNHHCVEGYLQYNSTAEADRARDGFAAASMADELSAGPTARVYVVERIDDVTAQIQAVVRRRVGDGQRPDLLDRTRSELIAQCEAEAAGRRCRVASFYEGLEYHLIVQQEIQDLRVVYAPPRSVGSYGGDIDNWMWPRHTGDFALLRAYVAPDGSAAPYAEENVPYQPAQHLALDTSGVGPGDFVMVAGFPGSTRRHDLAQSLRHSAEVRYPRRLEITTLMLDILRRHAAENPEAAAKLAAPITGIANVDKNNRELLDMLANDDLIAIKEAEEAALNDWLAADRSRRRTARAVAEMDAIVQQQQQMSNQTQTTGTLFWAADLLGVAHTAYRAAVERQKPDLDREPGFQERNMARIAARFERLEHSLYLPADRDVFHAMLQRYSALPADLHILPLDAWLAEQGGVDAAMERLYTEPALLDTGARLALLTQSAADLEASTDPWMTLAVALEGWLAEQRREGERLQGAMLRLRPQVMAAMLEMQGSDNVYPDANGTLRLTFGHVEGWSPADGVVYTPQTTLAGMVAKATGTPPFDAPTNLLARAAQPSQWMDPTLGDVPVNFLSTLDITGGNSGSATLNAKGELVGLAFDGNTDSIAADWMFTSNSRSIHVDIRYVLWVLEGDEDATWLREELGVE